MSRNVIVHRPSIVTLVFALLLCSANSLGLPKSGKPVARPTPQAAPTRREPPRQCPSFAQSPQKARVSSEGLTEASGLALSRKNTNLLWSHNDSGNAPTLFAISRGGVALGEFELQGVTLIDPEDLAIGPGPKDGEDYLYLADTGDNLRVRKRVALYRVVEPKVTALQTDRKNLREPQRHKLGPVERFDLTYPNLTPHDVEAILVDPSTADVYLVTKEQTGVPLVFRAPGPLPKNQPIALEQVAALPSLRGNSPLPYGITGASLSVDGRTIAIRTYFVAYLWRRQPGESVASALTREPCRIPLALEPQGEAIALTADGRGYFTTSEGQRPYVHFFEQM